ncbi:hypothetical protein hrd7_25370 [Leptolinea sp. HRD-7]|nr:hypothetical protein hrd7_25370 [Leptolinea sp. HRD-7]
MTNILTASEAAAVLRCESTDAAMLALLPQIDAYIKDGTGHDWTADSPIQDTAKAAARVLLVRWYEDPGRISDAPLHGIASLMTQLEVIALRYKVFKGLVSAGAIAMDGVNAGDTVSKLTGLIGATGDQSAKFESVISVDGEIQQTANEDLSGIYFRAYIVPPEAL